MSIHVEIIINKNDEIIDVKAKQIIQENYVKITNEYKNVLWKITNKGTKT